MLNKLFLPSNILNYIVIIFSLSLLSCGSSSNKSAKNDIVFLASSYNGRQHISELYHTDENGGETKRISHELPAGASVVDFSLSPDGKYVAYRATSGDYQAKELYIAKTDGSSVSRVSAGFPVLPYSNIGVGQYTWSYDSQELGFLEPDIDNIFVNKLFITSVVDGQKNSMTLDTRVSTFQWSPDSKHIAYVGMKPELPSTLGLYVSTMNGKFEVKVSGDASATGLIYSDGYVWSPNSLYLAYIQKVEPGLSDFYIVALDGSVNTRITNDENIIFDHVKWSPDSNRIAYVSGQGVPGVYQLYTSLPNGLEKTKISASTNADDMVTNLLWSPTGHRIIYMQVNRISSIRELYAVDPQGSRHLSLTTMLPVDDEVDFNGGVWSPDSTMLAYSVSSVTTQEPKLYVINPDNADIVSVVSDQGYTNMFIQYVIWSPDSKRIVYRAALSNDIVNESAFYALTLNNHSIVMLTEGLNVSRRLLTPPAPKWLSGSGHLLFIGKNTFVSNESVYKSSVNDGLYKNVSGEMFDGNYVVSFDVR